MQMHRLRPNAGKRLSVYVEGRCYVRLPVRTHVVMPGEDLVAVLEEYARPYLRAGDLPCLSEKMVAITQGRAYPIEAIKSSGLARFLCQHVHKSRYGIGLGSPSTMELAIREVGVLRILAAAFLAAITKPLGIKRVFYLVCGRKVAAIDGPCKYTLPPYNGYAVLAPDRPNQVAHRLAASLGSRVAIVDANDLGVTVLGRSDRGLDRRLIVECLRDNPMGQGAETTPVCIIREMREVRERRSRPHLCQDNGA